MSAWNMAAVAGGVFGALVVVAVLARLVVVLANLDRATRELGRAIDQLRIERVERTAPGGSPGARANGSGGGAVADGAATSAGATTSTSAAANGSGRRRGADRLAAAVDVRARLSELGLVSPVIKARALGRGTSRAAGQFRQRRER